MDVLDNVAITETNVCNNNGDTFTIKHEQLSPNLVNVNKSQDEVISETTIFDLPRQVWLEISDHLGYASHLNLRRTCRHFLHLIDTYLGLRATFTSAVSTNPELFDFFTNVALNDIQFEDASNEEQFNLKEVVAYPRYLTDVSFTGRTNLNFIQDMVRNCANLQLIEMTMDCQITTREENLDEAAKLSILSGINILTEKPPTEVYLRNIECLKLVPGYQNDANLRSYVVLSILRATKAPEYLRKVIFQCELTEHIPLRHVLNITAELMERHPNLEALFLAFLNDEYLMTEEDSRDFSHYMDLRTDSRELEYFRNRIVATGEQLQIKKMGLAMLNMNLQLIWSDFLRTQHHLVHLSLTVTIGAGTFSQELFDSFAGTLEQVAIRGRFEEPFDFLHISNCRNLKEICLHNLEENGGGGITPKCINLPHAPDDLESLILFQVVARTEEIQQTIRNLAKLTTLVLFKCGHAAGETGVGLDCLLQILHKRSLQSILMVQFICGSTAEAEALAGVLYRMSLDADNLGHGSGLTRRTRRALQQNDMAEIDLREIGVEDDNGGVIFLPLRDQAQVQDNRVEIQNVPQNQPDVNNENLNEPSNSIASNHPTESDGFTYNVDDFPPLPEIDHGEVHNEPLEQNGDLQREAEANDNRNNNNDNNNNGNGALNLIQDILQHAIVAHPDDIHRQNPHLQNHMHLNHLAAQQEFDEEMELILDVGGEPLGPVLDLFAAERLAREHNVQVGFILDGVIDILNDDAVRSRWLCVEDKDGHITYTLKISVEL